MRQAEIVGKRSMVDITDSLHGQTWEGRYILPSKGWHRQKVGERKTRIKCPICSRRFLCLRKVRPIGRVIYVEGPPNARGRQAVIYDPMPRNLAALICTSSVCLGTYYPMPHAQLRKLEAACEHAS